MEVNLPDSSMVKAGNVCQLTDHDDPTRWWTIDWVSNHVRDKSQLNRTWNNNI